MNANELIETLNNQPELFIGETLKDLLIRAINRELEVKTGERYNREAEYYRWGKNSGSLTINKK